jgi:hypothetical protein
MLSHCKRCAPLVLLLLGGCSLCTGDMTFDEDLVASFKEYAEEPLKSIRQTKTRGTCSPMIDPATQDSVCQTPPVQDWSIRWKEVDHESYVPQTYFYSRSGRPLNIINSEFDPDFTHDPQL